uniref:Uncharacterized protein n=1 Tax=Anguilla anguilla TaxID=7936 RepID=A0A0E9XH97_ANGAN
MNAPGTSSTAISSGKTRKRTAPRVSLITTTW